MVRVYCLSLGLLFPVACIAAPDGKQLFDANCAACHGPKGTGDGPAAKYVYPKPRDFTRGTFKVRSTPDGDMPTADDLFNTITRGMPGSAMPSFAYLPETDRRALVAYVQSLVTRPQEGPPQPIAVGQEPPVTPATVAQGKDLYAKMQCFKCHGDAGKGDGPSAAALKDSWDYPIKVRDFTTGVYLGGPADRDLYLRFTTGVNGTPMPSYADSLNDQERWALVHYVQSLRVKHEEFVAPAGNVIRVPRVRSAMNDRTLAGAPDAQVPLMVMWPCPHPLQGMHVRTAHNDRQIGFLLEWDAPEPSHSAVGMREFRDGAAVQFSMTGSYPFLGMGDAQNPVNVWHWKSDWQAEVDGHRLDVDVAHANLHVDTYPRSEPIFITARAAGNLIAAAKRTSPVEDLNAAGFGTLTAQPSNGQNVSGHGVWKAGRWRVVFLRVLQSRDKSDQAFAVGGNSVPVAFAVWAGEHGDRDGQKAVSTWFNLELEK